MSAQGNDGAPPAQVTRQEGATVLVVDDDEDARELVAEVLRDEGFRVCTACDGIEALELAGLHPQPVAMLLDLTMPRMGGRDVLERIRSQPGLANLRICVVSAETEPPVGADLAVSKPLLVDRLVRVLTWLRANTSTVASG